MTSQKPGWEKRQNQSTPGCQLLLLKISEANTEVYLPVKERLRLGRLREGDPDLKNRTAPRLLALWTPWANTTRPAPQRAQEGWACPSQVHARAHGQQGSVRPGLEYFKSRVAGVRVRVAWWLILAAETVCSVEENGSMAASVCDGKQRECTALQRRPRSGREKHWPMALDWSQWRGRGWMLAWHLTQPTQPQAEHPNHPSQQPECSTGHHSVLHHGLCVFNRKTFSGMVLRPWMETQRNIPPLLSLKVILALCYFNGSGIEFLSWLRT